MADVKRCDNPGCKKIGEAPFEGWLYVSREDGNWFPTVGDAFGEINKGPWDFCSHSCLAVWSAEQMKKGHRRGPNGDPPGG